MQIVRTEGRRDYRGGSLSGSHPHVGKYSARSKHSAVHRAFEREEQLNDFRQTCEFEVQICKLAFLA